MYSNIATSLQWNFQTYVYTRLWEWIEAEFGDVPGHKELMNMSPLNKLTWKVLILFKRVCSWLFGLLWHYPSSAWHKRLSASAQNGYISTPSNPTGWVHTFFLSWNTLGRFYISPRLSSLVWSPRNTSWSKKSSIVLSPITHNGVVSLTHRSE